MSRLTPLLVLVACGNLAPAQVSVPKWSVYEVNLTASGGSPNWYADPGAVVTATFRGPGGIARRVSGFWDGGDSFKIRLTPTVEGTWTYRTSSPNPGLDGKSGKLNCTAPLAGEHGFLRRDEAHPYAFVWDDGTRYFMWGQTYYDVMLNVLANGGWREAVDQTAAHGMNKIRLHVFAQKNYKAGVEETTYPQAIPYGGDYSGPDRDRLNVGYWQGLDAYVKYLASKRILADLILFNPYGENMMWGTEQQDERYARYVLARYAAFPHVIWCLANEWNYSKKPQSFFDRIGTIVREEDPWAMEGRQARALSIHQGTRIDFSFFGSNWPSYAIVQYGVRNKDQPASGESRNAARTLYRNGDEWGNASIVCNLGHGMPVVNDEYGYLGEDSPVELTQEQHRRAMWGIAAAGGYGSVGDYRMERTGNPEISGDWVDAPEYDDIRRLMSFFTTKGIEYWKMSSQNSLKVSGDRVYVLAETARQYLFYAAVGGAFSVNIAPGEYSARRFNPRTGEDDALEDVNGGGLRSFTMPGAKDWVVYLKRENEAAGTRLLRSSNQARKTLF